MLENIVIAVIIALAAAYVARSFYRKFGRGKPQGPDCGCSGCDCGAPENCRPEPGDRCRAEGVNFGSKTE